MRTLWSCLVLVCLSLASSGCDEIRIKLSPSQAATVAGVTSGQPGTPTLRLTGLRIDDAGIDVPGVVRIDEQGIEAPGLVTIDDDGIELTGTVELDGDEIVVRRAQ